MGTIGPTHHCGAPFSQLEWGLVTSPLRSPVDRLPSAPPSIRTARSRRLRLVHPTTTPYATTPHVPTTNNPKDRRRPRAPPRSRAPPPPAPESGNSPLAAKIYPASRR